MINWKVRLMNPVWWIHAIEAVLLPLIVGVGLEWSDMTTWATLGNTIVLALGNPVVVATMLLSLWNTVLDPTTKGIGDGERAMKYIKPSKTENDI